VSCQGLVQGFKKGAAGKGEMERTLEAGGPESHSTLRGRKNSSSGGDAKGGGGAGAARRVGHWGSSPRQNPGGRG